MKNHIGPQYGNNEACIAEIKDEKLKTITKTQNELLYIVRYLAKKSHRLEISMITGSDNNAEVTINKICVPETG